MWDTFTQQRLELMRMQQAEIAEQRRQRAEEQAELRRELRARQAQEREDGKCQEAVTIQRERLKLEAERLALLRQVEMERKAASRIAKFDALKEFDEYEVSYGRRPIEDNGSIRVEFAVDSQPPIMSNWFKCEDGFYSVDAVTFVPIVRMRSLAWVLGEKACREHFRLNKRGWAFVHVGEDQVQYAVDLEEVTAEGKSVSFDLRADDSVFHVLGDCRKKKIQIGDENKWTVPLNSGVRKALDLACKQARTSTKDADSPFR